MSHYLVVNVIPSNFQVLKVPFGAQFIYVMDTGNSSCSNCKVDTGSGDIVLSDDDMGDGKIVFELKKISMGTSVRDVKFQTNALTIDRCYDHNCFVTDPAQKSLVPAPATSEQAVISVNDYSSNLYKYSLEIHAYSPDGSEFIIKNDPKIKNGGYTLKGGDPGGFSASGFIPPTTEGGHPASGQFFSPLGLLVVALIALLLGGGIGAWMKGRALRG